MSFPFDAVAALARTFRELNEPAVGLPSIAPVAVVADYSLRNTNEGVEARGLAAWDFGPPPPGEFCRWQIHAPVRPVVLDYLQVKVDRDDASLSIFLGPDGFIAPVGGSDVLTLGGVGFTAQVDDLFSAAGFAGQVQVPLALGLNEIPPSVGLRGFIPRGQTMSFGVSLQPTRTKVLLLFREIVR